MTRLEDLPALGTYSLDPPHTFIVFAAPDSIAGLFPLRVVRCNCRQIATKRGVLRAHLWR